MSGLVFAPATDSDACNQSCHIGLCGKECKIPTHTRTKRIASQGGTGLETPGIGRTPQPLHARWAAWQVSTTASCIKSADARELATARYNSRHSTCSNFSSTDTLTLRRSHGNMMPCVPENVNSVSKSLPSQSKHQQHSLLTAIAAFPAIATLSMYTSVSESPKDQKKKRERTGWTMCCSVPGF